MKYLLDTHAIIWALIEPDKLSSKVRKIIENPENIILVSSISLWEISLKYSLGKLGIIGIGPDEIPGFLKEMGIELISLEPNESATYHYLNASWHKDPFDKMLIWQTRQRNLTLISADKNISKYQSSDIKVIW